MKNNLITGIFGLFLSANLIAQNKPKPNVLFIFSDDQTFESIGSLNNNEVKTPNLDRLRRMGTTFSHTFNQGSWSPAVSVASRAMLNTGKYLWKAKDFSENTPDNNSETIPKKYWSEYMKAEGYDTYFAGKWHVDKNVNELFDITGTVRGGMPNQTPERYDRKFMQNEFDTWSPYEESFDGYWEGGKHWSEVLGDEALGFLKTAENIDTPFFMYLAFNAPHDPRQSPQKYVDMYPIEDISIPMSFLPEYPYCEEANSGRDLRDETLAPFPRTAYSVKVNRQEYYAIISHMDEQIGRILDALDASGKAENTYIIFTSDHGLAVGDHGFIGKQNMYDRSMRVPLFIAGPDMEKGKVVREKVYLQDAMATSLDIAGSSELENVDFDSLLPLCKNKSAKGHDAVYGAYLDNQRMIRTDQYKMILYPKANIVRLYSIEADSEEMIDLASDKNFKIVMNQLLEQLQILQVRVGDTMDVSEHYNNYFLDR